MNTINAHEALVAARNLIAREGWTAAAAGQPGGPHSVVSAIRTALSDRAPVLDPWRAAHIDVWAAAPGRTEAQVLAALDGAISATAPSPADPFSGLEAEAGTL